MNTKKLLLCPPTYYDIEYEINPWMHVENKVNQSSVHAEYAALRAAYKNLGLEFSEIDQVDGLPDMVYSANFGFPTETMFIKSNYKYDERKKEADYAAEYFAARDFEVKTLPEDIAFEGQGDLLTVNGNYFFGWGKRSDLEAKPYLEELLGKKMIDFKLVNPFYYHLDTCFAPLNENTVVINPVSFEKEGKKLIYELFPNVIEASTEDNHLIACNLVVADKTIVIAKGISQGLRDDFATHGFSVCEVPMDEYRKGGGSVKCLTLEIYK
jgi:N-dimethylarginine dimethylaminohydrolase